MIEGQKLGRPLDYAKRSFHIVVHHCLRSGYRH